MTKLELNNKLAKLYVIAGTRKRICGIDSKECNIYAYDLLIDDWNRLMDLAVDNHLNIGHIINDNNNYFSVYATANDRKYFEDYAEHESPQAATRYAIAMALVKLKEVA